jgi:hypothetical protein
MGAAGLLSAVREASRDTLIITNGFSCHEQIEQLTERRPLHLAQVIQMALRQNSGAPIGDSPESRSLPALAGSANGQRKVLQTVALLGTGA